MVSMSNPYDENPHTQQNPPNPYAPSGDNQPNPYAPSGQYQPSPYAPGGSPAPYNQPYGAPPEHPQGTMILVLGIVGIFTAVCAPIAWVLGSKAKKEIAASGIHYSNEQNVNIGRILGMVFSILYAVSIVLTIVAVIILFVFAASTSGG